MRANERFFDFVDIDVGVHPSAVLRSETLLLLDKPINGDCFEDDQIKFIKITNTFISQKRLFAAMLKTTALLPACLAHQSRGGSSQ